MHGDGDRRLMNEAMRIMGTVELLAPFFLDHTPYTTLCGHMSGSKLFVLINHWIMCVLECGMKQFPLIALKSIKNVSINQHRWNCLIMMEYALSLLL